MTSLVSMELRSDGVALVRLEDKSSKLNTLSQPAIDQLAEVFATLATRTNQPRAVVLTGKPGGGLGAGANIGELMSFSEIELRRLIGSGHRLLNQIEDFPLPVVANLGNLALGGILELGLAPRARVLDATGQIGFPEINLLLFPGLFGGARAARLAGLGDPARPEAPGAVPMILSGKSLTAQQALAAGLVDEVVPTGDDLIEAAVRLALELASGSRQPQPRRSFTHEEASAAAASFLPGLEATTKGRGRPRAGFVFLDLLPGLLTLPRAEAQELEMGAFCALTLGPEGKAGMRFFFTNTAAGRPPKPLQGVPHRELKCVGVAGIDGYMGNAIGWLALANARLDVVGWTFESAPNLATTAGERIEIARKGLVAKYAALVKKGILTEEAAQSSVERVHFTTNLELLGACDVVIEAIAENTAIKQDFYEKLGRMALPDTVVASNSSSMGPGFLAQSFEKGGGNPRDFLNLHFFSPAELPAMALTELITSEQTSPEAAATAFALARSMKKTPVLLRDGSRGFFVNAVLAAYMAAAEALLQEGTSVEALDAALTAAGMPQGYATLLDAVGLDTCAGMLRFIGHESSVLYQSVEAGRLGKKSGGGFYDYADTSPRAAASGVYEGLYAMMPDRGSKPASAEEITDRCFRAMYETARKLLEQGIVDSKETADLAMILGLGFPVYLGGIFYYAEQRGWIR